jgi:hypothetical protein
MLLARLAVLSVCTVVVCAGCDSPERPELVPLDASETAPVEAAVSTETGWVGKDRSTLMFVSLTVSGETLSGFVEFADGNSPDVRETLDVTGTAAGPADQLAVDFSVGDDRWVGVLTRTALTANVTSSDGSVRRVELAPGNVDTFNTELSAD